MSRSVLLRGGAVYAPSEPSATAMLVVDGVVAWLGSEGGAAGFADGADEVVELRGAWVAPAFVDAHVHATSAGLALTGLDLAGCGSLGEALDRVARYAAAVAGSVAGSAGGVVLGTGWDESGWPERRAPTRRELDRAGGGAWVYLSRADVHSAVVSSPVLAAVPGVEAATGYGESGWVTQEAHHLVRAAAFGAIAAGQRDGAQRAFLARAAALGIGAVHECGGPIISDERDFTGLLHLGESGGGPRVFGYWGELGGAVTARRLGAVGAGGDVFVDGALGSRTARLRAPYLDGHGAGVGYVTADQVAEHVVGCVEAGMQPGFHVIGDAALDAFAAGLDAAAARVGADALREAVARVEHAEMADDGHIAALARHGVVASVQPGFDAAWGGGDGMYAHRLGAGRAVAMNPFARMSGAGVVLAFGSDAPVTPVDPWGTVRAAAFHRTPESRMTVRAGFAAHTRGGWRALGPAAKTAESGVLAVGEAASYAVWRVGELEATAPDLPGLPGLPDLAPGGPLPECLRTVVAGRVIHDTGELHG